MRKYACDVCRFSYFDGKDQLCTHPKSACADVFADYDFRTTKAMRRWPWRCGWNAKLLQITVPE